MEEEEDSLVAEKWVRLVCDFGMQGVTDRSGAVCLASDLPVSKDLIERILKWQQWYDFYAPPPFEREGYVRGSFDVAAFSAEGLEIAREVKRALADWTVMYFDEAKSNAVVFQGVTAERSFYEYEILG